MCEQNSTRLCSLSIYRLWRDREGWRPQSLHGFLSLVFRPSIQCLIHILWCMLEPSCICILFLAYVSWVLANIMTGCSCYFWKCDRNLGCRFFVYILTWTFEKIIIDLSAATIRSWWHQWEVIAASHCHSWWEWFSGHKLVTRLFCADFVFSGTDTTVTFKLTLVFSLNFIHMHVFLADEQKHCGSDHLCYSCWRHCADGCLCKWASLLWLEGCSHQLCCWHTFVHYVKQSLKASGASNCHMNVTTNGFNHVPELHQRWVWCVYYSLLHRSSAGLSPSEEIWAGWGLPWEWNSL